MGGGCLLGGLSVSTLCLRTLHSCPQKNVDWSILVLGQNSHKDQLTGRHKMKFCWFRCQVEISAATGIEIKYIFL